MVLVAYIRRKTVHIFIAMFMKVPIKSVASLRIRNETVLQQYFNTTENNIPHIYAFQAHDCNLCQCHHLPLHEHTHSSLTELSSSLPDTPPKWGIIKCITGLRDLTGWSPQYTLFLRNNTMQCPALDRESWPNTGNTTGSIDRTKASYKLRLSEFHSQILG